MQSYKEYLRDIKLLPQIHSKMQADLLCPDFTELKSTAKRRQICLALIILVLMLNRMKQSRKQSLYSLKQDNKLTVKPTQAFGNHFPNRQLLAAQVRHK